MPQTRSQIDQLLVELEAKIKRRGRMRGRYVFWQLLAPEIAAISGQAEDPAYVLERVRTMLVKHQHDLAPRPLPTGAWGQATHLIMAVEDRSSIHRT